MTPAEKLDLLNKIVSRFTASGHPDPNFIWSETDPVTLFVLDHIRDGRPYEEKRELDEMFAPLMQLKGMPSCKKTY